MIKNLVILPFLLISNSQISPDNFLDKNNFYYENDDLIVKGNISDLNSDTFDTQNLNKDLLIFDKNSKIDDQYFAYFYDYESKQEHYLETNSTDDENLVEDLNSFYKESNTAINNESVMVCSNDVSSNFKEVFASSFTKIAKPYGRITYNYSLNEYEFSSISSLYILQVRQQFICGATCIANDENGYGYYYNSDSYTHIKSSQSVTDMGYDDVIYSGEPVFKDAYPVPEPTSVTISSSYSTGITIGKSDNYGFSCSEFDSESHEYTFNLSLGMSYSKSYTTSIPSLSSQNGEDINEYQWNFKYLYNDNTNREVTNFANLGYIFECNKYENNLNVHNKFNMRITGKVAFTNSKGQNPNYVTATKLIL